MKNKNKLIREVLLMFAMLSLATVLIVSVDVVTNKEVFEKDGFYKTKGFMEILRNFNSDIVDLVKNYKSEEYIKSKDFDESEIEAKRQQFEDDLRYDTSKLNTEYNNKVNGGSADIKYDELDQLKTELNKNLQKLKEDYNSKINNTDNIKKEIIDKRLKTLKSLQKRIDSFKNIKYVAIDGSDGTTNANIKYDANNIKNSFSSNTGFYLKVYNKSGDSNIYKDVYDCNVHIDSLNSGKSDFGDLVRDISNSNVTIYMSVSEKLSEGDAIYFAYRSFSNLKAKIINEAIIVIVAFIIFLASLVMLIRNKKSDGGNGATAIRRLPLEITIITGITLIAVDIAILVSYYAYYPYRKTEIIGLVDIEVIVSLALSLIIISKLSSVMVYKEIRQDMIKRSLSCKLYKSLKKSVVYGRELTYMRSIFFKAISVACLGVFVMLPLAIFAVYVFSHDGYMIGGVILIIVLMFSVSVSAYVLKKLVVLDKIIVGAEKITNGDLNYTININEKGNLSKLADNINNMKTGLKSSMDNEFRSERLKTELITNVSHDLKTPLTSIINYVDLLKNNNGSPEDMKNYIDILDRKSQRLKALIEDLFEASKAASGSLEMNIEKVEVTSLLKQTLAEFEEKISEATLDFRINYPEVKLYIMADGKKLWRVFENLINNILKYSLRGTRVYITVNNENDKIKISMKNISAYELDINPEEILERFKRGDQSRHTEGSGLGLAIAKSLIELQNGNFNIKIDGDLFKANIEFEESK